MRALSWLILLTLIFGGGVAAQEADHPLPVIIDTDFAADDWMAILYLLQHPGVNVQAITLTGAGETHCEPGVQNALNLIALAGHPDIPVTCGRETPLEGRNAFPSEWRAAVDTMLGISLDASEAAPYDGDAVALLQETITASEQMPVLLTLGPLTNIAELFAASPEMVSQVARIVIMGGAVDVPGNVWLGDGSAEWNIYVDPVAADQVLASGATIALVPLDATNDAPATPAFVRGLRDDRTTPSAEFVYQILAAQSDFIGSGGYYFWDPLAAAVAADPTLATWESQPLSVVTIPSASNGRTTRDEQRSPVGVAVSADSARFEQTFRNVLNGRPAGVSSPNEITASAPEGANAALVRRYFEEGWAEPNLDLLNELTTPEYTLTGNDPAFASGIGTLLGTVTGLHHLMPDLTLEIESLHEAGDMVFARVMIQGTLGNEDLGDLATGAPVILALHSQLRIEDGKVAEEWHGVDVSPLLFALNAIKPEVLEQVYAALD